MKNEPRLSFNDGRTMPQLGFGLWRVAATDTAGTVGLALDAGYRLLDTARLYDNEAGVGAGIADSEVPRDDIFVTTKLWNDDQGYDAALRAFDASMTRLGLETLDLYLIHWPCPARGLAIDTWRALIRLREEGRVRSIGVSNFTAPALTEIVDATGVVPVVNQIELHPSFQQRALRSLHADLGIVTQCWRPLGRGHASLDPAIATLAAARGRNWAQIVLRWHIQSGLAPIPKSATPDRIISNRDVFDFSLSDEEMAKIDALDRPDGRMGADPDSFEG